MALPLTSCMTLDKPLERLFTYKMNIVRMPNTCKTDSTWYKVSYYFFLVSSSSQYWLCSSLSLKDFSLVKLVWRWLQPCSISFLLHQIQAHRSLGILRIYSLPLHGRVGVIRGSIVSKHEQRLQHGKFINYRSILPYLATVYSGPCCAVSDDHERNGSLPPPELSSVLCGSSFPRGHGCLSFHLGGEKGKTSCSK